MEVASSSECAEIRRERLGERREAVFARIKVRMSRWGREYLSWVEWGARQAPPGMRR